MNSSHSQKKSKMSPVEMSMGMRKVKTAKKIFPEVPWLQDKSKSPKAPQVVEDIEIVNLESSGEENEDEENDGSSGIESSERSGEESEEVLELNSPEAQSADIENENLDEEDDSDETESESGDSSEENVDDKTEEVENVDEDENQSTENDTESSELSFQEEIADDSELNNLINENESSEDANSPVNRDFDSDQERMEVEMESSDELITDEMRPTEAPFMRHLQDGVFYRKMDSNSIFVSIVPGNSLYFSGKCSVKVLKGVIEIYGCQLTSEEPKRVVFSPKGNSSLLSITSLASESEVDMDMSTIKNKSLPKALDETEAAMIIMELFESEWCEGIRNYCSDGDSLIGPSATGMGPGKMPKLNEFSSKLGFQLMTPSQYERTRLFASSPLWDEILYSLQLSEITPRVAIFGGKGVGKSTFFRWTVNKCLSLYGQSVLCVDLDPGQTEFTPPGTVTVYLCEEPILGPNFTHLVQPLRSVFIGSINVSDCPTTYKNAVRFLYQFVSESEELSKLPWIINTMGFSMGLGVHLACEVINIFQPTAVVQITIENRKRSFPFELHHKNVNDYQKKNRIGRTSRTHIIESPPMKEYQFFTIESVCNAKNERNQNPWGGRPKDLRENCIVSYFAQLIGATADCNFLSIVPYQVKLTEVAIGAMSSDLSYDNLLRAINGNLVALCEFPQTSFISSRASEQSSSATRQYILNGSSVMNSCLAYGVVRGMDLEKGILFIITPISEEMLKEKVNTVVAAGGIGLPIQFYKRGSDKKSELPYVTASGSSKTKLDTAAKKHFNYKRTVPNVLKNSLK